MICLVIVLSVVIATTGLPSVAHAVYQGEYRILVLHSYHRGYKWTDDISEGIEKVLKESGVPFKLTYEYMDTKKVFNEDYLELLKNLLREKYHKAGFDLIIGTDDNAFDFLLQNRDNVFAGAPVVFCGANFLDESRLEGRTGFTGVSEDPDFRNNIETILRLHPKVKKIAFITDVTTSGNTFHGKLQEIIPDYPSLGWMILKDLSMEALLDILGRLENDTVVLFSLFARDKREIFYEYYDSVQLITEASPVPVYGMSDISLGYGIVGGVLTSGFFQGQEAGYLALRVMRGEPAETIPVVRDSPNHFMFDKKVLDQFHISTDSLPGGSIVINLPFSIFKEYRKEISILVTIFSLLFLSVVIMFLHITGKRKAQVALEKSEQQVRISLEEKKILLKEIHHRVKNNLQVISGLLNLQAHHVTDNDVKETYKESQNRVISMALIHEELYQSTELSRIDFGAYIKNLSMNLFSSYNVGLDRVKLELDVQHKEMVVDTAIPCGLIINELISNALKHAFPDNRNGSVRVTFREESEKQYHLEVADDGVGMPADLDINKTSSLGMQLITIIAGQLGGKVEVTRDEGTVFRINFSEYQEAGAIMY
jgi:two-component sensor histidine kinase/ABC-type uncharacterized transport system substrate-binding protein